MNDHKYEMSAEESAELRRQVGRGVDLQIPEDLRHDHASPGRAR